MERKIRRHHTPAQKVRILRMHLLENKPISEICEGEEINPTLFYQWQKAFFENGTAAFERSGGEHERGRGEEDPRAWRAGSDARMR